MPLSTMHLGYAPDLVAYRPAWELQRRLHAEVVADPSAARLLLLEHEATYTAGRRTRASDRPSDGTPVIDVDRGGLITWHGPGQLVAYPIVPLADPVAVKDYVHRLEAAIIDTVAEYGVEATRVAGRAGVWVLGAGEQDRKIAAIGIHVEHGVSMHGLALNVCNDLAPYDVIVPCGISDAGVTTLAHESGRDVDPATVAPVLEARLRHHLAEALAAQARTDLTTQAEPQDATHRESRPETQDAAPREPQAAAQHATAPAPSDSRRERTAGHSASGSASAPSPGSRRLLRVEARNAAVPVDRKPEWIRAEVKIGPEYVGLKSLVKDKGLHTVCEEAGCPNIFECWEDREATFLIGGSACTRRCDFCQIDTGKPSVVDRLEPTKVARSIAQMNLRYATVTGVARDDLEDEGTWLYAETVRKIHELNPGTGVELLIPDFSGDPDLLDVITASAPEVYAHNVETVPRLFKRIRPAFRYERSLATITHGRDAGLITKSNLILGMGEEREEISQALRDLREAGTDIITLTQYLRPTERHLPVDRWVRPEEFVELSQEAEELGYLGVMAGPLVRSSYRAGRLWARAMRSHGRRIPEALSHIEDSGSTRQEAATLLTARAGA